MFMNTCGRCLRQRLIDPEGAALKKVNVGKYGVRWHDGKGFVKTPWLRRVIGGGVKRFPIYWASCLAARAGHKVAGVPYEGDPEDILYDIFKNLVEYGINTIKDDSNRKKLLPKGWPDGYTPPNEPLPWEDVPCGFPYC